jgi:hypothetical protein
MRVKPIEYAVKRYVGNSAQAFLERRQSFNWIKGVLLHSGLSKQATLNALNPLRNYGDVSRAQILFSWLGTSNW